MVVIKDKGSKKPVPDERPGREMYREIWGEETLPNREE